MSGSSDYTQTPILGLYKPTYDADDEMWGQHLNLNADTLDHAFSPISGVFLPLAGGVMGGAITLAGDPVAPLQPVTLQYLNANVGTGGPYLPLASGGTVNGPTIFTQSYTGNFSTLLMAHGSLGGVPVQSNTNWSQIALDADYADAAASGGPGGINYLYVGGNMNAGFTGHRTGINSFMYVNGTPGSHATTQFVTALVGWSSTAAADNGQNNSIMGGNLLAALNTGATSWGGLCGLEVDITAQSGTSVNYKEGVKVVVGSDDAVAGTSGDFAFGIAMASGSPGAGGFKLGFSFGSHSGVWPMLVTSTLIGTSSTALGGRAYSAARGIDFSAVTFSQAAFMSTGFTVNQTGGVVHTGTAGSNTDLSRHIGLESTDSYGINYLSNSMNVVIGGGGLLRFIIGGATVGYLGPDGTLNNFAGLNNVPVGQTTPAAGSFTALTASGLATANGGQSFGSVVAGSLTDLSHHIALYGTTYGINVTGGQINFTVSGGNALSITGGGIQSAGPLFVAANQVVAGRITGYGTPTGPVKLTNFPGASATLAQTSAMVAQLITDLKTHGLLGA